MNKDLISVIVPVYKVEQYLNKCIESIVSQTYQNMEIILVDDGSPDLCPGICDEWAERDERIRVIHKENGGLSDARNTGIENAHGNYLVFVDSDDYVDRTMIEKLYVRIIDDHSELALCGIYGVDYGGRIEPISDLETSVWDQNDFWDNFYKNSNVPLVVAWNKLYSSGLFEEERYDTGKIHEDEFIIHRLIVQCKQISVISDRLYYYVQRQGSITKQENPLQRFDAVEAFLKRSRWFNYALMDLSGIPYVMGEVYVKLKVGKNRNLLSKYKELKAEYNKLKLQVCLRSNVGVVYFVKFFAKDIVFNLSSTALYYIVRMKRNKISMGGNESGNIQ